MADLWKFGRRPELFAQLSAADRLALQAVGEWVWCFRCARVWPVLELHLFRDDALLRYSESPWCFACADPTCGGAGLGDHGDLPGYAELRRRSAPEWPPVPIAGQVLLLVD